MSYGSIFRTRLGDVVRIRFDDDGNEHVTMEWHEEAHPKLELVMEPDGLEPFTKYRQMTANGDTRP
jgi:hypothetical protein